MGLFLRSEFYQVSVLPALFPVFEISDAAYFQGPCFSSYRFNFPWSHCKLSGLAYLKKTIQFFLK